MSTKSNLYITILNNEVISIKDLPIIEYDKFYVAVSSILSDHNNHCLMYYALADISNQRHQLICCIANDIEKNIHVFSHTISFNQKTKLKAITEHIPAMHIFEREIWENYGIEFTNHPWLKPVRFPANRANQKSTMAQYPFYKMGGNELHEVGVGPIHAGVIEPGHFRFICDGEQVLHLEIQLGWQHRGVEKLFLSKTKDLERTVLAENISGDSTIAHTTAFAHLMESLANIKVAETLEIERTIALELERLAMHTADISALCVDTAYQFGANVTGALRTPLINLMQSWCGNRFGKGLIRIEHTNYEITGKIAQLIKDVLSDFIWRFEEIAQKMYNLPSQQNRFDGIGTVTTAQAKAIGAVGMTARMTNLSRDSRWSHPNIVYQKLNYEPVTCPKGDVFARFLLRRLEVVRSVQLVLELLKMWENVSAKTRSHSKPEIRRLQPSSFSVSIVEGWRGEICHAAITDENGIIAHYKIKDPSMHNWKALELSLRDLEISDFPINNKSYNLSYCGHDL